MATRRLYDLGYGHPGALSYSIQKENGGWIWSRKPGDERFIRQLGEFKNVIPPSISHASGDDGAASLSDQTRWLYSRFSEIAAPNISNLIKAFSIDHLPYTPHEGCLLTVGSARSSNRIYGSRRPLVIAFASGAAGDELHLVQPMPKVLGWKNNSTAKLTLLDPENPVRGCWKGVGGPIRQIVSAADPETNSGPWLAVRQDSTVTMFLPTYGTVASLLGLARHDNTAQPSLHAGPVATLSIERTGSRYHVDFAFNPFYPRQFAVVDEKGHWSIWNLENRHQRRMLHISPGRSGYIFEHGIDDGKDSRKSFKLEHADGWHKVMWACDINTLVVCSRRSLAVYNVEASPERLQSVNFIASNGFDWILDATPSSAMSSQLFVLTTSHLYWIKIIPAGDHDESVRVLCSYRHYISPNDETMRLTVVNEEPISVIISSSQTPLIKCYTFQGEGLSSGCTGQFPLNLPEQFRSLHIIPCLYESGDSQQAENQTVLYQIWGLSLELGVFSALLLCEGLKRSILRAPNRTIRQSSRARGARTIKDHFIVPDEEAYLESSLEYNHEHHLRDKHSRNAHHPSISFNKIFTQGLSNGGSSSAMPDTSLSMVQLLTNIESIVLKTVEKTDLLELNTLAEIGGLSMASGELQDAGSALLDFIERAKTNIGEPSSNSKLVVSDLTICPGITDLLGTQPEGINLLKIHDKLVEYFISNLSPEVPNSTRLRKFKLIRQLGIDIALSSVGISLQPRIPEPNDILNFSDSQQEATRLETRPVSPTPSSIYQQSSQPDEWPSSFRTPSMTPSLYSRPGSEYSTRPDLREDPAISRLRQYTRSIKSRPPTGKSYLLANWQPGVDPYTYSYRAAQKSALEAEETDETQVRGRRRKERGKKPDAVSRPAERSAREATAVSIGISASAVPMSEGEPQYSQSEAGERSLVRKPPQKKAKKHRKAGF